MTMFFFLIIMSVWFVIAVVDYGELCYIWQLKEYRLDRFRDFLSTRQGKNFLKSYLVSGRLFILAILVLVTTAKLNAAVLLPAALLLVEMLRVGFKLYKRRARYPQRTMKSLLVIFVALILEIAVWVYLPGMFNFFAVFALRFLVISLAVLLANIPTKMMKYMYVLLATRKLKKFPNLKVVGITGSYGKTTVKYFLNQILSSTFKVVATPKNINTEIGVAKFILETDFSGKEIFVVEMGAYNMGEIKMICDMVRPEIGILTAINEQHLSLFGSLKNIQKAKYELLLSLPKNGLAITNADNEYCTGHLKKVKSQVLTFGSVRKNKPDCLVGNMKIKSDGEVGFSLEIGGTGFAMRGPLVGTHNALNVAACTLAANYLGIGMAKIARQVETLKMPAGTLQISNYGQSLVLDDSYNANPAGFRAALEILRAYPNDFKKIVITRGMIELGEKSSELHMEIGKMIGQVADELIIIANNNADDLKMGVGKAGTKILTIFGGDELSKYVQKIKKEKCVVLLENRVPANVHIELTKN